jgi:hypothetical protein
LSGGKFQQIAKQSSNWDITDIQFSPIEAFKLCSCGKENIRFWRIEKGHLPGCAVVLNHHARKSHFTCLDFDLVFGATD